MASRAACLRMNTQQLKALHESVEQVSGLAARFQRDRKAAHAEIFTLLAELA
jgi:hypothetical protein